MVYFMPTTGIALPLGLVIDKPILKDCFKPLDLPNESDVMVMVGFSKPGDKIAQDGNKINDKLIRKKSLNRVRIGFSFNQCCLNLS